MDERTKDLLVRVLDMDELEMRAALIAIATGATVDEAVDGAFNYFKREAMKMNRIPV